MRALLVSAYLLVSSLISTSLLAQDNPVVVLDTNKGTITAELWADRAPITVQNFLRYTNAELYDGLIFHRVIPGFMVQGGGFNEQMNQLSPYEPIKNEARSDVPNKRATLAMARTNVVDSATSQFFINLTDNDFLNHSNETPSGFGYAVFGEVIEGMDVVDEIAAVETGRSGAYSDVPLEPVIINSVRLAE